MIGREHRLEKDAHGRRLSNIWHGALAAAVLSLAGLALTASVASASGPAATTEAASGISYQKATLNGTVNPEGVTTTYHFEYGETTSYGTTVPVPDGSAGNGTSNVKVSQVIRGLKVGPTYHFRIVAKSGINTTYGEDRSFTTASWAINGQEPESPVAVSSNGTLKIVKTIPPILGGGSVTVECAIASEGTVAGAGAGEVTHVTLTGCKVVASTSPVCKTTSTVERSLPRDLPWRTALATVEGATRELLSEDGKGAPGFEMECAGLHITGTGNTSMGLSTVTGGVNETFDSHSEELKWDDGGKGTLEGTQLVKNPASGTLAAAPKVGEWLLSGVAPSTPVTVSSKGTLDLGLTLRPAEGGGEMRVECENNGEGTVAPGGEGEDTAAKLTGCVAEQSTTSYCPNGTPVRVTALDLPWRTVLVTKEGATRALLLDSGKGAPGYRAECGILSIHGTGKTSVAVRNVTGGVEEAFDSSSERLTWSSSAGLVEGSGLLTSPSGALTFKAGS